MDSLVLSKDEIIELTHYRLAAKQMVVLEALGIPAYLRHDNTVCVLRVDLQARATAEGTPPPPMRKSVRVHLETGKSELERSTPAKKSQRT